MTPVTIFFVVALLGIAFAQPGNYQPGQFNNKVGFPQRTLYVEKSSLTSYVHVYAVNQTFENAKISYDIIDFQMSTVIPEVIVGYQSGSANFDPSNPSVESENFRFGNAFTQIIEFNDTNGNKGYDGSVDEVVSRYSLIGNQWKKFESAVEDIYSNSSKLPYAHIYTFNATTIDGIFSMQFKYSDAVLRETSTGTYLTPNSTKINIQISQYPFKRNGTYLALESYLFSQRFSVSADANIDLSSNTSDYNGYFSWEKNVFLDNSLGKTASVKQSAVFKVDSRNVSFDFGFSKNDEIGLIYFTIDKINPDYVLWDPVAGYGENPTASEESSGVAAWVWVVVALGAIAVVAMVIGGFIFYRKRAAYQSV